MADLPLTPYERFQLVFRKWFRFASNTIGHDVLDKDFKVRLITRVAVVTITSAFVFSVYTMVVFEAEIAWRGAAILSISLQGLSKSYCLLNYRSNIVYMSSFIENIYLVNEKDCSRKIKSAMNEQSSHLVNLARALFGSYFVSIIVLLTYPVLAFMIWQMKEPFLPVMIPGLDMNTKVGYVATAFYHFIILYLAGFGLGFCDGLFCTLVFNLFTKSRLLSIQLAQLNEDLDSNERPNVIRKRLTNFFLMHQEMQKYVDLINESYFWMIFVQICTTAVTIAIAVYILIAMSWFPAYFLVLTFVFQIFIFCAMGSIVDVANDKLEYAILKTNYYLLPHKMQKDFMFMINIIQRAKYLKAGNSKLDVGLFVLVMQKIYTFIMVLHNVIE